MKLLDPIHRLEILKSQNRASLFFAGELKVTYPALRAMINHWVKLARKMCKAPLDLFRCGAYGIWLKQKFRQRFPSISSAYTYVSDAKSLSLTIDVPNR